jgi:hypothetical protein
MTRADRASAWMIKTRSLGVPLDRPTIDFLMAVYACAGNTKKTETWAKLMQQEHMMPSHSTLSALVVACKRAGNIQRAGQWLNRMQQLGFDTADLADAMEGNSKEFLAGVDSEKTEDLGKPPADVGMDSKSIAQMLNHMKGKPSQAAAPEGGTTPWKEARIPSVKSQESSLGGPSGVGGSWIKAGSHRWIMDDGLEQEKKLAGTGLPQEGLAATLSSYELPTQYEQPTGVVLGRMVF